MAGRRIPTFLWVTHAAAEVSGGLQVVSDALEERRPVMFYCKAGKDRTGLLAMLLLTCAGASDEQIIEDYFR